MEVTVLGNGCVALTQSTRLAQVCRQIGGKSVDVSRADTGKNVMAFCAAVLVGTGAVVRV
jgi:hypothetical protein